MKLNYFLSLTFLLAIVVVSCKKDYESPITEPGITHQKVNDRTSPSSPCSYPQPLCERMSTIHARIGSNTTTGTFDVIVNGAKFRVLPFKLSDESSNPNLFLIKSSEGEYVLKFEQDSLLSAVAQPNAVPAKLRALSYLKSLPLSIIENLATNHSLIEGSTIVTLDGSQALDLSSAIVDENGDFMPVPYCDFIQTSYVQNFINEFVYDGVSDPALLTTLVTSAYESANCSPQAVGCNKCVDTKCVIDNLLALDANVLSDYSKGIIVANYLRVTMGLSNDEYNWLTTNRDAARDGYAYISENSDGCEESCELAQKSVKTMIAMQMDDLWDKSFDDPNFIQLMETTYGAECIGPMFGTALAIEIGLEYGRLRVENPSWSEEKLRRWAYLNALGTIMLDKVHLTLDAFGLVPGFGEVADLTNGVIYTIQGDGVNATLSFAATIPFAGWASTGTKYAVKVANGLGGETTLRWILEASGKVNFGDRNQLRKIIGLCDKKQQAHHLLPWVGGGNHELVQAAAKLADPIHLNDLANGVAVAAWRNQPNHNTYDLNVTNLLNNIRNDFVAQYGSLSSVPPQVLKDRLKQLQDCLKAVIVGNPTLHLNNLTFIGC
jgi:hypothetical protein